MGVHSKETAILLVDDEPSVLFVLSNILQEEGYEVQCANDGVTALQMFREKTWDLVITDFTMPNMNGQELAGEIRAMVADFPIILITGFLKPGIRLESFCLVLKKPFSVDSLLRATKTCLLKTRRAS